MSNNCLRLFSKSNYWLCFKKQEHPSAFPLSRKGASFTWSPRPWPSFLSHLLSGPCLNHIAPHCSIAPALNYCKSLRRDPPVVSLDSNPLSLHFKLEHITVTWVAGPLLVRGACFLAWLTLAPMQSPKVARSLLPPGLLPSLTIIPKPAHWSKALPRRQYSKERNTDNKHVR